MSKIERLNKRAKEIASNVILHHLNDPRIKNVTVLNADFSIDLSYCTINVSVYGTKAQVRTVMRGLKSATGYIQKMVAEGIQLRYAAIVRIEINEGPKKQQDMSTLIDDAIKKDEESKKDESDSSDESADEEQNESDNENIDKDDSSDEENKSDDKNEENKDEDNSSNENADEEENKSEDDSLSKPKE